jgi:CBS domain-containing protein
MQRTGGSEGASHSDNDMPKENTMSSISGLLQNKKPLVTTRADEMVAAAVAQMTGADIGAVLVVDELGRIAGIFTERDCLQKVTRPGRDPGTTPLREVMTTNVRYAKPKP